MESAPGNSEFEFDVKQNELMADLSAKMNFVGLLLVFVGLLNGLTGIVILFSDIAEGISSLVTGVVFALVGFWTRRAAASFTLIVDTEGHDISNLMSALGEVRKLYALQYWAVIVSLVLLVIALIFGGM